MKFNNVLAIAINNYDNSELNKIQNCNKDVSSIIKVLTEKYSIDDVEFISEKTDTTRKSLYNKLNEYFINRLEDENVLLIYAGHGEYNEKLKTAYWQPSDADPNDSSTWLNIIEIMSFIRASQAFHIGVISDSCFSGAMFESNTRGGGIEAFNSKKSRLGLTSGSLEKVSDGHQGELSPFADSLIKILNENIQEELPFSVLGANLIMGFNTEKKQTPMCGPLHNVGHEGGSFSFKLKSKIKKSINIHDKNQFLLERMANLFIPISKSDLKIIDKIEPIKELKTISVINQNYTEAARHRDKIRTLEKKIKSNSSKYLDSFFGTMDYSPLEVKKSKELDLKIAVYKKEIEKVKSTDEEKLKEIQIKHSIEDESTFELQEYYTEFKNIFLNFSITSNPAERLFLNEKENFVIAYKRNIFDVYNHMMRIKCLSKSEFLNQKIFELKEILIKIYDYEIGLILKGYRDELDEIMTIKELDVKVLNWIKHN